MAEGEEGPYVVQSTAQVFVRSLFMVDLSRLREETDTLEGAKVLYLPESDFKKVSGTMEVVR